VSLVTSVSQLPPEGAGDDTGSLAVLNILAAAAGVSIDPIRAANAVRIANREIPPTHARAARLRLTQAASAVGVQFVSRLLSTREALAVVAYSSPLALFTVTPDGHARWFVLTEARGGRGRLARLEPGDEPNVWRSADELARRLGAEDADEVLEWIYAQPAVPMPGASALADDVMPDFSVRAFGHDHAHGHGHGHGHGHSRMPPFRRLLGLLQPERADLWVVILFAIGVGIFTLAVPIVAMAVVNTVALGTLVQQLVVLCLAMFIALSLAAVLQFLQTITVEFIQRRLFVRVAADLAYRLPRVDLRAFDRQHGPELVNRFFDVLTVQKSAATLLLDGITIALQVSIGLGLIAFYHRYLIGFDLALLAALAFLFFVLSRGAVRTAIRESIAKFAVAGWMEEVARHPVAFKLAGGPTFAREKTDALTREYLNARIDHFRILMRQYGFSLLLQATALVGLLAIGGYLVIIGELTLGELVAAEIVVTLVVATFAKLGKQLEAFYDLLAAVEKLGHLIDLPLERAGGVPHVAQSKGAAVVVHDVTFTYEGAHRQALAHLSLRIEPGERVALVGPNGAGKSTLVDLLFGLRPPADGWVEIDGADVRDLRLETLREHVAVVKGVEIFEGTVLANVRMGRESVTVADAREALRKVGLLHTILDLPDGLNTILWTGGSPLSLGQANRLMLARAIVGQPRLLILDEALDHMDAEVRETVLPAVIGREARWTLLVVTHSDEVARLCDRVVKLERPHSVAPLAPATPH
jgi:putative ABC transport system ATP-binding protein